MKENQYSYKNSMNREKKQKMNKPFVSLVVPGYDEEAIVEKNLNILCQYMKSLENEYQWELIFINDGSKDETGKLAEVCADRSDRVHIFHHMSNLGLGQAFRTAFSHCRGDYVVTLDIDLSFSPDHIEKLLDTIRQTQAEIVIASPNMKGGKLSNIPFLRKVCTIVANRFLSFASPQKIHNLTGMVRAYKREFLNKLNLKAMDMEVNPEIIYKAQLLRARIVEIPAHLDWSFQKSTGKKRKSHMKIFRGVIASFMSGFIFRPFMLFITIGIVLFLISLYVIAWIFIHVIAIYPNVPVVSGYFDNRFSEAVAVIFRERPHAFFIGGMTLLAAIQFFSLGILSVQNKRYFEELFHFNSNIYKQINKIRDKDIK